MLFFNKRRGRCAPYVGLSIGKTHAPHPAAWYLPAAPPTPAQRAGHNSTQSLFKNFLKTRSHSYTIGPTPRRLCTCCARHDAPASRIGCDASCPIVTRGSCPCSCSIANLGGSEDSRQLKTGVPPHPPPPHCRTPDTAPHTPNQHMFSRAHWAGAAAGRARGYVWRWGWEWMR